MDISGYKNLSLDELRNGYCAYLKTLHLKESTISTSKNDTFYIWNKGNKELFWKAVESDDEAARNILLQLLSLNSKGVPEKNVSGYLSHIRKFRTYISLSVAAPVSLMASMKTNKRRSKRQLPSPSTEQVELYLKRWNDLENYKLQEEALDKLFFELAPKNEDISDILLKAAALNDFYSTNIFSIFPVAQRIQSLHIDKRLSQGDESLVMDIQRNTISGVDKNFYSFATKYCSHHKPAEFPIYDSYVDEVLRYFRKRDNFESFSNEDLKDYPKFKKILEAFRKFYKLDKYNLKEIDKYLWQLGKEYFPKNYGKNKTKVG